MQAKKKLLVSFSGGRTSGYMVWWLQQHMQHVYDMIFVFANTGKEREETLQFVRQCDEYFGLNLVWVEGVVNLKSGKGMRARVVNFDTASRNGEPFEAVIQKFGIPNKNNSFCSRDLKGETIKAYLRSIGWKRYHTALGIRYDEPQRINPVTAKRNRLIYPLYNAYVTKSDVNLFWSKMPFDLQLKSYEGNCDLCWKKSDRKLMTLLTERPEMAAWWQRMEQTYENHLGESRKQNQNIELPMRFFREKKTIADLLAKAATGFTPAEDESHNIDKYKQMTFMEMVDLYDPELDLQEGGCAESCEAFQY